MFVRVIVEFVHLVVYVCVSECVFFSSDIFVFLVKFVFVRALYSVYVIRMYPYTVTASRHSNLRPNYFNSMDTQLLN